ncbi:MAG TPA: hypothetical protein VF725_10940 [Ktedonobacterales bacterium]
MTEHSPQDAPTSPDPRDDEDDLRVSPLDAADGRSRSRLPAALRGPALRRLWRWMGAVATLALAAIVIVTLAPHIPRPAPSRPAPIPYTRLRVSPDVARCMSGFSWSHDSRQIAALTSYDCASANAGVSAPVSKLYIFNAATGASAATIDMGEPLDLALRRLGIDTNATAQYGVSFFSSAWSPDDRLLAAQFAVYSERMMVEGVVLATIAGAQAGHVTVLTNTPIAAGTPGPPPQQASAFTLAPTVRWDLTTGAVSTIYLQPALAYRWLPGGVLVAAEPLADSVNAPPPSDAGAPTDDPVGGEGFSLWRTGYVTLANTPSCEPSQSSAPLPVRYAMVTLGGVVWSPGGRYLLDVNVNARLLAPLAKAPAQSPTSSSGCVDGAAPDPLPTAALHDRGLAAAVKRLDPTGSQELSLAWSPDGRRLAALTISLDHSVGTAALYDCASGTQTHAFTSGEFYNPDAFSNSEDPTTGFVQTPAWSPDSSHLLLVVDGVTPQVIVLGPAALGG